MTSSLHRDSLRYKRPRETRSHTVNMGRVTLQQLELWRSEAPPINHSRPRPRSECVHGPRPCPYVGCRWHLYLDVVHGGNIRFNFPDLEPHELETSCALDVADSGPTTLDALAPLLNVTRARVQQLEQIALTRLERLNKTRRGEFL